MKRLVFEDEHQQLTTARQSLEKECAPDVWESERLIGRDPGL